MRRDKATRAQSVVRHLEILSPVLRILANIGVPVVLLAGSTGVAVAQVPFGSEQVISTAADAAVSVFAIDLDGDGDADVLSASFLDDTIAWYENRLDAPTADFGPQQAISTGAEGAISVFAKDLDRDGDADVLSASSTDNKIAWYENRLDEPTADFGSQQVISTNADEAISVLASDLDGDGDADVLSASFVDDKVAWYENRLNEPTADFGFQQVISTGTNGAISVFATDLDRDGDADVVAASFYDDKIVWYENRLDEPSSDFGSERSIPTYADGPQGLFAIDLDRDGDADVVSVSFDDTIAWHENLGFDPGPGSGNGPCVTATPACFGAPRVISTAADGAISVHAIDLDGDGDAEIISASLTDDKIAWYENRLDEPGSDFGSQQVISTGADGAYAVFAMDLDGDGDGDLLSASQFDDKVAWYENRLIHRSADFSGEAVVSTVATGVRKIAAGDVDRDGEVDLFAARPLGIDLFRNAGDGESWSVTAITSFIGPQQEAVYPADLDRNGDLDLLSARSGFFTGVFWHENPGGNGTGTWNQTTITTTSASDVRAADLDGDGDHDALFASGAGDQIAWLENRLGEASADFGPVQTISTAVDNPRSVFAADIDSDGDLDVLSASALDDKVAWYENLGGGTFHPQQILITAAADGAQSVFAADLDRDGDLDVLSASFGDDRIAWYANDGSGIFTPPVTITTAADGAASVWAADMDFDGDLDVVSASENNDQIAWYENVLGDGSIWNARNVWLSAVGARHATAADVDGDGALDIVAASSGNNTVAWHPNRGGQFTTQATDTAQKSIANGQLEDVLAIEVTHLGRDGDNDVELTALEIQLLDSGGTPLASAQANALIETLRLYRDDGSGVFEESKDSLVTTLSSFALDINGLQTIALIDDDPNARVAFVGSGTFFVTFEMTPDAEAQAVTSLQVLHYSEADEAEDASADLPLSFVDGSSASTGIIDTALTTASCQAPFDLNLESRTIDSTLICEAGTVLRFGSSTVTASGILTLRAGLSIELETESAIAGQLLLELEP